MKCYLVISSLLYHEKKFKPIRKLSGGKLVSSLRLRNQLSMIFAVVATFNIETIPDCNKY